MALLSRSSISFLLAALMRSLSALIFLCTSANELIYGWSSKVFYPRHNSTLRWTLACSHDRTAAPSCDVAHSHLAIIQQAGANQYETSRPDPRRNRPVFLRQPQLQPSRPS